MCSCGGYLAVCGLGLGLIVPDMWYCGGESAVVAMVGGCGCDGSVYESLVCCEWEA